MPVTVLKDKDVTVVTVAADGKSAFPPLCQILMYLGFSPECCSVYKGLMQTNATVAVGTMQILVGLFSIGLGPGRTDAYEDLTNLGAPYWLGAVHIATGIMSILSGQYPTVCLVCFTVFLNIVGTVIAVIGIVLYATDLGDASMTWMCDQEWTKLPSDHYDNNCRYLASFAQKLLIGMDVTMILMTALQMCACIAFTVLGVRALVNSKKEQGDVQTNRPLLNEAFMTSPGA